MLSFPGKEREENPNIIYGPHRVFPGRLSVSRTFGDIEAKKEKYGGNPNVVIATPDIKEFMIDDKMDFLLLGCDGIFERLNNRDCIDAVWERICEQITVQNRINNGDT